MTSRLPSVWPSLLDNGDLIYFDEKSLGDRGMEYTSNWGLTPINIVLEEFQPGKTSSEYKVISGSCEDSFILSFENLSKWYYFFTEYYNLLKKYGHCNMTYTSAEDYYNHESIDKYASEMVYGSDRETYIELDRKFTSMGGIVLVTETGEVVDNGFFKWICDNVVPSFQIPITLRNYWKRDTLFYPDVIGWLEWFNKRNQLYDGMEEYQCKTTENVDCCDCVEYFSRGGNDMFTLMQDWYGEVEGRISSNKDSIESSLSDGGESCWYPHIILPTEILAVTDNVGERSILSDDYKCGEEYHTIPTEEGNKRTQIYYESGNTHDGTVATIGSIPMILSGDGLSFEFDDKFMEKYISTCNTCGYKGVFSERCPICNSSNIEIKKWIPYTEHYLHDNANEFITNITLYTFDENNVKVVGTGLIDNALQEIKDKLTKVYEIQKSENGWIFINGSLYPVGKTEYGIYDENNQYLGGREYPVFRDSATNTPYTSINGKKIYAELYVPKNVFYFPFFKVPGYTPAESLDFDINEYKQFSRVDNGQGERKHYIEYMGDIFMFDESLVISGVNPIKVVGHSVTDDGIDLYIVDAFSDENIKSYDEYNNELVDYEKSGYNKPSIDEYNTVIKIVPIINDSGSIFEIYNARELVGTTSSKLIGLRSFNTLVDDIGNEIDGINNSATINGIGLRPKEGAVLEPIYQVGNTANVRPYAYTLRDDQISGGTKENYYVGDIITDMTFYYLKTNGEVAEDTIVKVTIDNEDGPNKGRKKIKIKNDEFLVSGNTSLSAITVSTTKKEEIKLNKVYTEDDILCDVTYHIGATLVSGSSGYERSQFMLSNESNDVEYIETVRFVLEPREFYLGWENDPKYIIPVNRQNPCNHSLSYTIYVYRMVQDITERSFTECGDEVEVSIANFQTKINLLLDSSGNDVYGELMDMARHNNVEIFPTFGEEYRLGISVKENVDSDIYIDRGINSAYEKHLKLGEVTSLEALENYGINFFEMMNT